MFARVTRYQLDEGRASESIEAFAAALDKIRTLDGFIDGYYLVERGGTCAMTVTLWDSVGALERSQVAASSARTEAVHAAGGEIASTHELEVGAHTGVQFAETAFSGQQGPA